MMAEPQLARRTFVFDVFDVFGQIQYKIMFSPFSKMQ